MRILSDVRMPISWPGADLAEWVFLLLLPIANTEVQAEDFAWTTNNGLITITSYIGPAGTVTIPETITGLPVTAIGAFAFQNRANLTSITSPGGLTSIGDYAFGNCARLISFTMPDSVTNLGIAGFSGCSRLQSVTLSTNLTSLPDDAFNGCSNLTSIIVPNSVTNIGARAFLSCGILTSATIGSGALNIDLSAFYGCTLLIAITVDALNNSYSSVEGVLFNKDQTTLLFWACLRTQGKS